jgi:oxygen-dependent protoporphyrinogen oxidase
MKRIAVIGGGVSGLSAAFSLQKEAAAGAALEYTLFESIAQFGGVLRTERVEDCVLEAGPDSFLTEKPWAAELCRELGIENQLIGSNDAERKTYMWFRGRLVPIPDGLMFMVPTKFKPVFSSPLFSWGTRLRIVREWFHRGEQNGGESTVAEFVERHYGREMVERIADPLLAGVYGGSADELSVQAVLPRFAEMEAKFGSLGKAMIAARKRADGAQKKPLFTSLKNGMQQLTDSLLARIPDVARRPNTPVDVVKRESGKWLVVSAGRTEEFDGAVLATPAYAAAAILNGNAGLAEELNGIPYSSSVTVGLIYDQSVRAALPPGFGFLVPRTEGMRILAATFVHNKFPHRAPADRAVIRCFLGGSKDEAVLKMSDDEILTLVQSELRQILGVSVQPLVCRVHRWKHAMAQYGLGHTARVARIGEQLAGISGLALAGNAYSGIGVPDCVRSGSEAAAKILADLSLSRQPSVVSHQNGT